jgi:rhamnose transport system substrate-binding protein
MTTKQWMRFATAAVVTAAWMSAGTAAAETKYRVALLVKNLGNGFFDAAHQGGEEAA